MAKAQISKSADDVLRFLDYLQRGELFSSPDEAIINLRQLNKHLIMVGCCSQDTHCPSLAVSVILFAASISCLAILMRSLECFLAIIIHVIVVINVSDILSRNSAASLGQVGAGRLMTKRFVSSSMCDPWNNQGTTSGGSCGGSATPIHAAP